VGPTASGKTDAVLALARETPGLEVISADSRQIYRGMNVGTAKPTPEQRAIVPHHLIDLVDPDRSYSAGTFAADAERAIGEVETRGGTPMVVGGTALYVKALLGGLDDLPKRSGEIRKALEDMERRGDGTLRRFLRRLDPARADEIAENDVVRLTRALEIVLSSGRRASVQMTGELDRASEYVLVGVRIPRETLRQRIDRRTERMFEEGLLNEVKNLTKKGYGKDSILGRTIGYAEVIDLLEGGSTLKKAKERVRNRTWHYARRQMSMFERMPGISWWDGGSIHVLREMLFPWRVER
jgi:tRNA dimethylallyltransferase